MLVHWIAVGQRVDLEVKKLSQYLPQRQIFFLALCLPHYNTMNEPSRSRGVAGRCAKCRHNMTVIEMFETASKGRSFTKRAASGSAQTVSWLFRFFMKLFLVAFFVCMGLFVGGFLQFSNKVTGYVQPADIEAADAIAVLTGGSSRIEAALDLLAEGKGKRLLITGVNAATRMEDIKARSSVDSALFSCCVDMESIAVDTIGNAVETAKWVDQFKYSSLIVVTSSYHMPRSIVEFKRNMPDTVLTPYPVLLDSINRDDWWHNAKTLRFMLSEYLKFLGARSRDYLNPQTFDALRSNMLAT